MAVKKPRRRSAAPAKASPNSSPNGRKVRRPKGDITYDRLKELIIDCEFRPEHRLTESALSIRLRVGKAPVRFALARLRQEKLVVPLPRQGYLVSSLSLQDIDEIYQVRLLLEPHALRAVAARIRPDVIARLRELAATNASPPGHVTDRRLIRANRAFHCIIGEESGNVQLASMIAQVHDAVARILALFVPQRTAKWGRTHAAIVAALAQRDGEKAAELQRIKLENSRARVFQIALRSSSLMRANLRSDRQS